MRTKQGIVRSTHAFAAAAILVVVGVSFAAAESIDPKAVDKGYTAAEYAAILRASDLAGIGWEPPNGKFVETWNRTVYPDKSIELEYEFETVEDEIEDVPFYLAVTVYVEASNDDAEMAFTLMRQMFRTISEAQSLESRSVDGACRDGESCAFTVVGFEGQEAGNQFVLRRGSNVFTMMVVGYYTDDPAAWREVVGSRIDAMARLSVD